MKKIIGFRVDANEHIASGHLMRCIAIAEACIKSGNKCIFYLAEEKMTERLIQSELAYHILNSKWNNLETEIDVLVAMLKEEKVDVLVVDSYYASKRYLESLNKILPTCYIDDMGKDLYNITMLLHYGSWPDDNTFEMRYAKTETKVLAGMRYVPLRSEFEGLSDTENREKSILITTGGTDPYNISGKVVQELIQRPCCWNYTFKVIVGGMNTNATMLKELLVDKRVELLRNIYNMGELMRKSQCAVSAGGTTLFELCACSTPTVCFSFAENQEEFCKETGRREVMLYAGDARKVADIHQIIANKVEYFLKDECLMENYIIKMRQMVDGQGARRIADTLSSCNFIA